MVLDLRFGLADDRDAPLEEVGHLRGVTRERIRQIQVKALNALQRKIKACPEHPLAVHIPVPGRSKPAATAANSIPGDANGERSRRRE